VFGRVQAGVFPLAKAEVSRESMSVGVLWLAKTWMSLAYYRFEVLDTLCAGISSAIIIQLFNSVFRWCNPVLLMC
jgi:hypothetical protein